MPVTGILKPQFFFFWFLIDQIEGVKCCHSIDSFIDREMMTLIIIISIAG